MDKRAIRGEETYNKIISTTIDIISEHGISGVSAAKVSQGAGISKSNVFHHFKSVNEILIATLNKITDLMVSTVRSKDFNTLEDMFNSLELTLFNESDDYKKTERTFFAFYNEGMFNKIYKEIFNEFLDYSIYELEETLVGLGVKKENAKKLSRLIIATLDGICIHIVLTDKREVYYDSWLVFKNIVIEIYGG